MAAPRYHCCGSGCCPTCRARHVEATLAGAITAADRPFQCLKVAVLRGSRSSVASMLASFQALTRCDFITFSRLNFEPLQALPNLSDLSLRSGCKVLGVGKLASLTSLKLDDAGYVTCGGKAQFLHGLKRLSVRSSTIKGLHDLGIGACSGLQHLSLSACSIRASVDQYALNTCEDDPLQFTRHISSLMQLTYLMLSGTFSSGLECPWLFTLTNLVCLKVSFKTEVTQYSLTDQLVFCIAWSISSSAYMHQQAQC